jgi:hypothetical protein
MMIQTNRSFPSLGSFVAQSISIHIQNIDATTTTAPTINAKNNPNMPNIPNIGYVVILLNVWKPLPEHSNAPTSP